MKKKIIIDILLFIFLILEFSRNYLEPVYHEIFGIILIILVIIHLLLNKNYLKNIPKGRYNLSRTIMLIINSVFFITFILSLIFGILSSQYLLTFLNQNSFIIIKLHKTCSYLSLIFMSLHLGLNFNLIFNKIKNNKFIYIIEIIIIIYGIYSFIKLDIIKHIIGTYGFGYFEGNILINLLNYLSIILMLSLITNKIYTKIKKEGK